MLHFLNDERGFLPNAYGRRIALPDECLFGGLVQYGQRRTIAR